MFERFTERARQVVILAQEEARRLKHDWIGTEHILLGLLVEKEGIAARALEELGITAERVREQAVQILGLGEAPVVGQILFTPRAKKVFELSLREGLSLGHDYIGTEHLLLGLVRENEGVAARILLDSAVDPDKVRTGVIRILRETYQPGGSVSGGAVGRVRRPENTGVPDSLVDGASRVIETLAREIEKQLGRPADAGDLLVLLACVPDGLAARTLTGLHVDVDSLQRAAEEARRKGTRSGLLPPAELVAEIERVRNEKEAKIEAAAERRDVERALENDARRHEQQQMEATLAELRTRLGLPDG